MLIAQDAWFRVVVLAGAMALLLTNAGIYAVIAFTVSRRTREIGVRVALGADPRRVVAAVLARTARHVGAGVLAGGALSVVAVLGLSEGSWRATLLQSGGLLAAYLAVMMGVCMLASVVPTRRALRIEPMEALSADG
jgi:ABC-type antimicrobial peptide transport system permease subunit